MISTKDLYENGFVSSEHRDEECHYIEFKKSVGHWSIDVINEIEGDIVSKQDAYLGMDEYYHSHNINLSTIEDIKALEKILTYEKP